MFENKSTLNRRGALKCKRGALLPKPSLIGQCLPCGLKQFAHLSSLAFDVRLVG